MMSMEVGAGAMIGVDIMTWPFGPIWGQGVHSSGVDLSSSPGYVVDENWSTGNTFTDDELASLQSKAACFPSKEVLE